MLDDACVGSDPDLQDATFAACVEAEKDEAAEISIAAKSDEAVAYMGFLVGCVS